MRGVKAKKFRRLYKQWLDAMKERQIPEGMRPISLRVWRRRVQHV
jgi:hypothetical protein